MEKETTGVLRIGVEAALGALILLSLYVINNSGREWFAREAEQEGIQQSIRDKAETYSMLSGNILSGNDVIEYILKHDMEYDYRIIINGTTYRITKEYAQDLDFIGRDGSVIWSNDYLVDDVFGEFLYRKYSVTAETVNEAVVSYTFRMQ